MTQPLMRQGDRSGQVADVQRRLRALGIDVADEQGNFGEATTRAVRAFQQRRGLIVDGVVGPHTWRELVEAGWRLGDRVLYHKHPPLRGDDVATLQVRLNALGYSAGKEDGIFGRNTGRAVRAFQKEYGVAEDGIFGPRTHAALLGLRIDRPGTSAALREELRRAERAGVAGALVVLDPGHGGIDPGEGSVDGIRECDVCWDVAVRVADRLLGGGAQVRFTRTEADGPEVSDRAELANELDADLFVSVHLNANPEPTAEGASAFYFVTSRAGALLADVIQESIVAIGQRDCRTHGRSYPILKETRMPAVIVEPAFITNPDEAKNLQDPELRDRIAEAIATGIRRYFEHAD